MSPFAQAGRRALVVAVALAAAAAASPRSVDAQSVFFSGYTNGCFGCGVLGQDDSFEADAVGGLTYENSVFAGWTVDGFLGIGANANDTGVQDEQNFGGLYLGADAFSYTGTSFSLLISLIDPGAHAELYTVALFGRVTGTSEGGVFLDFDNAIREFVLDGTTYSMFVNDVSVTPGFRAPITGGFFAPFAVVPEPISMVLLGTGLLGCGAVARRRRRARGASDSAG